MKGQKPVPDPEDGSWCEAGWQQVHRELRDPCQVSCSNGSVWGMRLPLVHSRALRRSSGGSEAAWLTGHCRRDSGATPPGRWDLRAGAAPLWGLARFRQGAGAEGQRKGREPGNLRRSRSCCRTF